MVLMKKGLKVFALVMACMMLFAACKKEEENTPVNTTPDTQQNTEVKEEPKTEAEPEVDPKEELLAKAEEDKEAVLEAVKSVIANYRSGNVPDYYEEYPAKESYPTLESVDDITLEKGDAACDVLAYAPVGNQNLCVALQYVDGAAEETSPWMVVAVSFMGIKG